MYNKVGDTLRKSIARKVILVLALALIVATIVLESVGCSKKSGNVEKIDLVKTEEVLRAVVNVPYAGLDIIEGADMINEDTREQIVSLINGKYTVDYETEYLDVTHQVEQALVVKQEEAEREDINVVETDTEKDFKLAQDKIDAANKKLAEETETYNKNRAKADIVTANIAKLEVAKATEIEVLLNSTNALYEELSAEQKSLVVGYDRLVYWKTIWGTGVNDIGQSYDEDGNLIGDAPEEEGDYDEEGSYEEESYTGERGGGGFINMSITSDEKDALYLDGNTVNIDGLDLDKRIVKLDTKYVVYTKQLTEEEIVDGFVTLTVNGNVIEVELSREESKYTLDFYKGKKEYEFLKSEQYSLFKDNQFEFTFTSSYKSVTVKGYLEKGLVVITNVEAIF